MKKEEQDYLIKEKDDLGLSRKQAYKEIECLTNSQKLFKEQKSQLKSKDNQINKLNKELDNLKEKIKSKDKQIFDLKIKIDLTPKPQKEDTTNFLSPLKRLITLMELNKEYTKTDLHKLCLIDVNKIDCAVKFLNEYKIFEIELKGGKYKRIR